MEEPERLAIASPGVYLELGRDDVLWGIRDPDFLGVMAVENFALRYPRREMPSEILSNPRLLAGRPSELAELSLRLDERRTRALIQRAVHPEAEEIHHLAVFLRPGTMVLTAALGTGPRPSRLTAAFGVGAARPPHVVLRLLDAHLSRGAGRHPAIVVRRLLSRLGASFVQMPHLDEYVLDLVSLPLSLLAARCGAAFLPKIQSPVEIRVGQGELTLRVVHPAGPASAPVLPARGGEIPGEVEIAIAQERYADALAALRARPELLAADVRCAMRSAELSLVEGSVHAMAAASEALGRHRARATDPASVAALEPLLASLEAATGNPAGAAARVAARVEAHLESGEAAGLDPAAAWAAELWAEAGQDARGVELVERALQRFPASPQALSVWANAVGSSRPPAELAATAEEMLRQLSGDGENGRIAALLHRIAGRALFAVGEDPGAAEAHLREAIGADPTDFEALEATAEVYEVSGREAEAAEAWRAAAAARPPSGAGEAAEALFRAGRLYETNLGDSEKAEACFREAAERAGGQTQAWLALAATRRARGAKRELREAYRQLVALGVDTDPDGRFLPFEAGVLSDELAELEAAVVDFAVATTRAPEQHRHWEAYVSVLERLQRHDEADEACSTWLGILDPQKDAAAYANVLLRLAAIRLYARKKPAEALEVAERARRIDRVSVEAWWLCGESLLALSRPAEAASSFDRAAELAERNGEDEKAMALRERLRHLYDRELRDPEGAREQAERLTVLLGDDAAAVEAFRRQYEAQGRFDRLAGLHAAGARFAVRMGDAKGAAERWTNAATVHSASLGDAVEAAACCERALVLVPDHLPALRTLFETRLALGENEPAEAVLHRLIDHPRLAAAERRSARQRYADALRSVGDPAMDRVALASYQQILADDPDDAEALLASAEIAERQGRWAEMADRYRRVLGRLPSDDASPVRMKLAWVLENKEGDLAGALEQFDAICANRPDDAGSMTERARLLEALGRAEEAVDACERALAILLSQGAPPDRIGEIRMNAARLLSQQLGNLEGARAHLDAAIALSPERREPRVQRLAVHAARRDAEAVASELRSLLSGSASEPAVYEQTSKLVQMNTADERILEWAARMESVANALRGTPPPDVGAGIRASEARSLAEARRPGPAAGTLLACAELSFPHLAWYFEAHFVRSTKTRRAPLADAQLLAWGKLVSAHLGVGELKWFEGEAGGATSTDFVDRTRIVLDVARLEARPAAERLFEIARAGEKARFFGHHLASMTVPDVRRLLAMLLSVVLPGAEEKRDAELLREAKRATETIPAAVRARLRDPVLMIAGPRAGDEGIRFALREVEEIADRVAVLLTQDPAGAVVWVLQSEGIAIGPLPSGARSLLHAAPPAAVRRVQALLQFAFSPAGLASLPAS